MIIFIIMNDGDEVCLRKVVGQAPSALEGRGLGTDMNGAYLRLIFHLNLNLNLNRNPLWGKGLRLRLRLRLRRKINRNYSGIQYSEFRILTPDS